MDFNHITLQPLQHPCFRKCPKTELLHVSQKLHESMLVAAHVNFMSCVTPPRHQVPRLLLKPRCCFLQIKSRVQMAFNPELCPEAYGDGLAMSPSQPYPFGVDPTWHGTRTELQFLNSVKMKLSILLGESLLQDCLQCCCLTSKVSP